MRAVRTLAGKANHFASILYVWHPFLSELWGALEEYENPHVLGHAPPGCIWVKQISSALLWFRAFLFGRAGSLHMTYMVSACNNTGKKLRIVGDASIYGLAAYLLVDQRVVSWHASPLTVDDEQFWGIQVGDHKSQQSECLNLFVALRGWKEHWATERVSLEINADNITALTMVMSLKSSSPAINRIARELALDLGDASFRPDVISHTPGVASCIADTLSRKFMPGSNIVLPPHLDGASELSVAARDSTWWRSLTRP